MIQRVYEQALKCEALSDVIIATDSKVIEKHVREFGGKVMMTSVNHSSGTERCREAFEKLAGENKEIYEGVINIQGDEPFIDPMQITQIAKCLSQPGVQIATLIKRIATEDDLNNPNVVKVVFDRQFKALYFSRAYIPYSREKIIDGKIDHGNYFKHIGIYGYRSDILLKIAGLPLSSLEKAESLEQLRWLENGYTIHVMQTELESIAIDTPADLLKITNRT